MPRSSYDWEPGKEFPIIQQHSVAKHEILRAYLCAYIRTLVSNPNREEFRLVLVDGFAGGGVYRDVGTKEEVLGSPFIMLEAAREAEANINVDRRKPVRLNIDYYFIEIKRAAAACLRSALMERGYGARLDRDIFVFETSFEKKVDELAKTGISDALRGRSFDDIKKSERDWRLFIQACLYRELVEQCKAKYYTLFFIRSSGGHGDYWLIHFSQMARARDVMTEIHWEHNNHFIHYGGAGLEMFDALGYVPEKDDERSGQSALFCFDVARARSIHQLGEQIAPLIYADPDGMTFAELFSTTCNLSPASADIYKSAIGELRGHREIEVVSAATGKPTDGRICEQDRIRVPDQRNLFDSRKSRRR